MKKILKIVLALVVLVIVLAGGYVIYMQSQYYRIEDYTKIETAAPGTSC